MRNIKNLQTRSISVRALLVLATVLVLITTSLLPSGAQNVKTIHALAASSTHAQIRIFARRR